MWSELDTCSCGLMMLSVGFGNIGVSIGAEKSTGPGVRCVNRNLELPDSGGKPADSSSFTLFTIVSASSYKAKPW